MRRAEQLSDQSGVSYEKLMENAGRAAADYIAGKVGNVRGTAALIYCGSGNNGGDGLVIAGRLAEEGAGVCAVMTSGLPRSGEAGKMYSRAVEAGVAVYDFEKDPELAAGLVKKADYIIDAIFGTGFHGNIREPLNLLVRCINASGRPVFSVDIPSGVDAETGMCSGDTVRADYTVTFEAKKPGHEILPGKEYCGKTKIMPIGMPASVYESVEENCFLVSDDMVFGAVAKKPRFSNKGSFGRALLVAGSSEFRGAAAMSALGALRSGAGIVTVATTGTVAQSILPKVPEATFCILPENEGGRIDISDEKTRDSFRQVIASADSVLIGPGIGRDESSAGLVRLIMENARNGVVADADALFAISKYRALLESAKGKVILTPHMGEMARLCGKTVDEIRTARLETALSFAAETGTVVVLKDATTVIATPDGRTYISPVGNPGLAKGGSGDVLAGIIASLSAQGLGPDAAAVCGVYLHGRAADMAAKDLSEYGMLPSDIPTYLCRLFAKKGL